MAYKLEYTKKDREVLLWAIIKAINELNRLPKQLKTGKHFTTYHETLSDMGYAIEHAEPIK